MQGAPLSLFDQGAPEASSLKCIINMQARPMASEDVGTQCPRTDHAGFLLGACKGEGW